MANRTSGLIYIAKYMMGNRIVSHARDGPKDCSSEGVPAMTTPFRKLYAQLPSNTEILLVSSLE